VSRKRQHKYIKIPLKRRAYEKCAHIYGMWQKENKQGDINYPKMNTGKTGILTKMNTSENGIFNVKIVVHLGNTNLIKLFCIKIVQ